MKTRFRAIYAEHKERYDYRRIAAALCSSLGQPINCKRVQRLMQQMGMRSLIRIKRRCRRIQGLSDVDVPNVLQRDFRAAIPNQKWVTDITEIPSVNCKGMASGASWTALWTASPGGT